MKNRKNKKEVSQPSYYAIIPAEVRYAKDVPFGARLLFGEIMALSNKDGYCWASNDFFTELYDVHQTTISEWISVLDKCGFIKSTVGKGNKRKITVLSTIRKKAYIHKEKDLSTDKEKHLNNNTSVNNTIKNSITAVVDTPADDTVFDSEVYFKGLGKSTNRLLVIVAMFALKKGVYKNIRDKNQASVFISQNVAHAKKLVDFDNDQILKAMDLLSKRIIGGEKLDWKLSTVVKEVLKS